MSYKRFNLSHKMKGELNSRVEQLDGSLTFLENPLLAGLTASLGIAQEAGGINDELIRHLFDKKTGEPLRLRSIKSELIAWQGNFGVRIWSQESQSILIDHPTLKNLTHPTHSFDKNGEVSQIVFYPQIIAQILRMEGVEPVIVKEWALNTVFGRFDKEESFYVTNDWEIDRNDGLHMTELLANRKIPFMGTHDLVAHISGVDRESFDRLQQFSKSILPFFELGNGRSKNHLIVPYLMGMLVDDLAQPKNYDCPKRKSTLKKLTNLQVWVHDSLKPTDSLVQFPHSFSDIIELARRDKFAKSDLNRLVHLLAVELQLAA